MNSIKTALTAALLAVFLSGCLENSPGGPETHSPGPAKALWQSARPDAYSYRLERMCFCMPAWTGPFLVEAEGKTVVRVRRIGWAPESDTLEVTGDLQSYSIDSALAYVETMLARDNHSEAVEYDPEYGFPAKADFDGGLGVADDEFSLRIKDFRKE